MIRHDCIWKIGEHLALVSHWNKGFFPGLNQANRFLWTGGVTKTAAHALLAIHLHGRIAGLCFTLFYSPEIAAVQAGPAGNAQPEINLRPITTWVTEVQTCLNDHGKGYATAGTAVADKMVYRRFVQGHMDETGFLTFS